MNEEIVSRYYKMLNKVQEGKITEKEWSDYCEDTLSDIMYAYREFLKIIENI